ncbi:excalibur calcium-binding domain-containing protein [Streptomyces sp. QH1-20]|uniref:excalibur calcium-binding domain-containing protein n=1 Tax=Streptomyces sp. QH1-20 TaxID=3240934 RepID=UPI0035185B75
MQQPPYPHPYAVPPTGPRPKWQHPVLIISLLVFLPPVGVLWVWLSRWPRRKKTIATVLSLLWFALILASDPPAEGKKADAAPKRVTAVTKPSASPTPSASPEPSPSPSLSPSPTPKSTPTESPKPKPLVRPEDRRWTSCAAAWKGGVPRDSGLTRDEHRGYRSALDADGDGHACGSDHPEEPEEEPTTADDSGGSASGGSSGGSSGGGSAYYSNCAAARAAGAAPIHRGQPGYRPGLDRDGDGVACDR